MKNLLISTILAFSIFCSVNAQQLGTGMAPWIPTGKTFNSALLSGAYGGYASPGYPLSSDFNFLFVIRHTDNNNNCQFQLSSSYAANDRLFFRKFAPYGLADVNLPWYELATRGTNIFTGSQ